MEGAREYLGPARFKYMEPAGFLAAAGCAHRLWQRLAGGSARRMVRAQGRRDTHQCAVQPDPKYAGRLSEDVGLTRAQVLRAITMNSSYELHQEFQRARSRSGKLADLIVLDRNVLKIPADADRRGSGPADSRRRSRRLSVADVHRTLMLLARTLRGDADIGSVPGRNLGLGAASVHEFQGSGRLSEMTVMT